MKKKLLKKVHCIEKGCTFAATNDASVAQLVEHLTLNQGVQGSTPCGSTKQKALIMISAFFVLQHLRKSSLTI